MFLTSCNFKFIWFVFHILLTNIRLTKYTILRYQTQKAYAQYCHQIKGAKLARYKCLQWNLHMTRQQRGSEFINANQTRLAKDCAQALLERLISLAIQQSCSCDLWSQEHVHSCYKCFRDLILHGIIPDRCWYPSKSVFSGVLNNPQFLARWAPTQTAPQHLSTCCCHLCLQEWMDKY